MKLKYWSSHPPFSVIGYFVSLYVCSPYVFNFFAPPSEVAHCVKIDGFWSTRYCIDELDITENFKLNHYLPRGNKLNWNNYSIYLQFEELQGWYLEIKLITTKSIIGTCFWTMVAILVFSKGHISDVWRAIGLKFKTEASYPNFYYLNLFWH